MLKAVQQALIKYSSNMFSYVWLYLAERFIVFSFCEVLVVCEGRWETCVLETCWREVRYSIHCNSWWPEYQVPIHSNPTPIPLSISLCDKLWAAYCWTAKTPHKHWRIYSHVCGKQVKGCMLKTYLTAKSNQCHL